MSDEILYTLTSAVIVVGVVGTIIPLLPGLLLIWLAALSWGVLTGFGIAGWIAMILITALAATGIYLSIRIPQRSAAAQGLSITGTLFGVTLAIIGGIAIPIIGVPAGFVLGVWLVRVTHTHDAKTAFRSALSTTGALLKASAAQFGVGAVMGLVWWMWALSG